MAKQVFIGSLFEFSDTGCEELINSFRDGLEDADSAPFVSYDKTRRIFSCAVDHNDLNQINTFIIQFQSYLEYHTSRQGDLVDSPRIRPIDGTAIKGENTQPEPLNQKFVQMVDYEEESEYSEDNSSLDHAIAYWAPANGDVRILTTDIAASIAHTTGCSLFAEPSERRVKLVNGDLQLALAKLQNLEASMTLISRHKSKSNSRADANVLAIRHGDPNGVIKLDRPIEPHCGFDRIMTNPTMFTILDRILLSEIRFPGSREFKPRSLDLAPDVVSTLDTAPSTTFRNIKTRAFGDPNTVKPIVKTEPASTILISNVQILGPGPGPNKYLQSHEANRVTEWTRGVEISADPDVPPAVPIPEVQTTGRRRVVAEDSSDEDGDEDDRQIQPNITRPQVEVTSTKPAPDLLSGQTITTRHARDRYVTANPFDLLGSEGDSRSSRDERQAGNSASSPSAPSQSIPKPLPAAQTVDAGNLIDLESRVGSAPLESKSFAGKSPELKMAPVKSTVKSPKTKFAVQFQPPPTGASPISKPTEKREVHTAWPMPAPREPKENHPYHRDSYDGRNSQVRRSAYESKQKRDDLIDISVAKAPSSRVPLIPPGFSYLDATLGSHRINLMDEPVESAQPPKSVVQSRGTSSKTRAESVISVPPSTSNWNPQHTVPKRDMNYLKEQTAARLQLEMNAKHKPYQNKSTVDDRSDLPLERIEAIDESRTRRYHQSMNQKTAKPKKGKSTNNSQKNQAQETKEETEVRRAKALADAYGEPAPFRISQKPTKSIPEPISAAKQRLIKKNPALATVHTDFLQKNALDDQTINLKTGLQPLFEACRAFTGDLSFEIQIGQALILSSDHINEQCLYKQKEWTKLVNDNTRTHVTFTDIVTTNGCEIDRLFSIQAPDGTTTLWSQENTKAVTTVIYSFRCLDKSGREFSVIIDQDQDLQYTITKNKLSIGKVVLHCPQQIWDACAVLEGQKKWADPPSDLVQHIDEFIRSVYVSEKATSVYYRLPSHNAFNVRDVIVERTSVHKSASVTDLQLKLTETKMLIHSLHPNDKKLFRSYELDYNTMVEKGKLHYKIAIVPLKINQAFIQNKDLEIGELTPEESSGKALLTASSLRTIVDVTTYLIEQIDWLGATNIGTMRRIYEEAQHKQAIINASLPPQALTQIGRAIPAHRSTIGAPTFNPSAPRTFHPAGTTPNTMHPLSTLGAPNETNIDSPIRHSVPGVRAGTSADLYHQDGQYFYLGMGGAKIPVVDQDLVSGLQNMSPHLNVSSEPLAPGDSASQIGGPSAAARFERLTAIRGTGLGVAGPRGRAEREMDAKPPGFW